MNEEEKETKLVEVKNEGKKKTKLRVTKDMVEKHIETVFEEKKIA